MGVSPLARMRRALVTGAHGFIGRRLVGALLAAGVEVVAVQRDSARRSAEPPSDDTRPGFGPAADSAVLSVEADLTALQRVEEFASMLQHVTHVFHLAALAHRGDATVSGAMREYERQNTLVTERLAQAAFATGVERFVFVSSIKVHGDTSSRAPIGAGAPFAPTDAYARSKMMAELVLEQAAQAGGGSFTIVRPPLVYGPGVGANFLRLLRAVDRGLPLPFALVRNRRSLIYVDNLVELLIACAASPVGHGARFVAADAPPVSTPALIRAVGLHLRRPARLLPVPPALLRAGGALLGRRAMLASLIDSLEADGSVLPEALGLRTPVGFDEAIARTVDWYTRSRPASG